MSYSARQDLLVRALLAIAAKMGPFTRDAGSEGAGYVEGRSNYGAAIGFKCENCAFFRGPKACTIMRGQVERLGVCRFYVIQQDRLGARPAPVVSSPRKRVEGDVDTSTRAPSPRGPPRG